jgi:hypothetical protein
MQFQPDRKFNSLRECVDFLLNQFIRAPWKEAWSLRESGLLAPDRLPPYLYRGEPGLYENTLCSALRPGVFDGLDSKDMARFKHLRNALIWVLMHKEEYAQSKDEAVGFLQHYGLPTPIVDFTADPLLALTFAGTTEQHEVCIGVMPWPDEPSLVKVYKHWNHPWANRARRQEAVGVEPPDELANLKSSEARDVLRLRWYQLSLTEEEREQSRSKQAGLLKWDDDESAGFLRFLITEYVEAHGKVSPALAQWLLRRIPIAARCFEIKASDISDVIVNFRRTDQIANFKLEQEKAFSRRYWGADYIDQSFDRMRAWRWPDIGKITADPRTYHADLYA